MGRVAGNSASKAGSAGPVTGPAVLAAVLAVASFYLLESLARVLPTSVIERFASDRTDVVRIFRRGLGMLRFGLYIDALIVMVVHLMSSRDGTYSAAE
jgi:hypothetical protein